MVTPLTRRTAICMRISPIRLRQERSVVYVWSSTAPSTHAYYGGDRRDMAIPAPIRSDRMQTAQDENPGGGERLRLDEFRFWRTQAGQCFAEVELAHAGDVRVIGRATGASSPTGDLRTAAEATLRAMESFTKGAVRLDLMGVKSLRAFDASVVIVAVSARLEGNTQQLLGCFLAEQDPIRGAVVAVLNATNRIIGNRIHVA